MTCAIVALLLTEMGQRFAIMTRGALIGVLRSRRSAMSNVFPGARSRACDRMKVSDGLLKPFAARANIVSVNLWLGKGVEVAYQVH